MARLTFTLGAFALWTIAWIQPATAQSLGAQIQSANEQLLNRGNLAGAADIFTADYTYHDTSGDVRGPEAIGQFVSGLRAAFPDLHVEVQILMEQGDKVAWIRVHRGTQRGAYMGVPPSGRSIAWQELYVTRFEGGKIAEEWGASDLGARLRPP